jgi:hypothetical protein
MKDYRAILEYLYSIRKSGNKIFWAKEILAGSLAAPEKCRVEKSTYETFMFVLEYLTNTKGSVSYKTIRNLIEPTLSHYDENYICEIGELVNVVELCDLADKVDGKELLSYVKTFLNF